MLESEQRSTYLKSTLRNLNSSSGDLCVFDVELEETDIFSLNFLGSSRIAVVESKKMAFAAILAKFVDSLSPLSAVRHPFVSSRADVDSVKYDLAGEKNDNFCKI